MAKTILVAALLAGTSSPASAQEDAAGLAEEVAAMRAKIESLEAKVKELEAAQQKTATLPSWKGAPQLEDKQGGFSFKPKGFAQFDTGTVGNPGIPTQNLGWDIRARRLVIGAEGTLPGGFRYNAEFNLAGGNVDYEDVVLGYAPKDGQVQLTLGNFFPLSGLETMTSSRVTSFLERAQAVDAFNFGRRLGAAMALVDPRNDRYTLTVGLFGPPINTGFDNNSWQASVRGTYALAIGENRRLHIGANYQHREAQSDAQNVRYRARPFTQITDVRFVDTGAIAAAGDDVAGLEFAAIVGPLHFASEAQRVWVNGYRPDTMFSGLDSAGGGLYYSGNPRFTSGYVEFGFFLTGETRGYKGGRWDRVKVLRPVGKGGIGAVQINGRIDYLDLADRLAAGPLGAPRFVNGGVQTGYELSAIWNPIDYVRFLLQYSHVAVEGGPFAATVVPGSTASADERDYDTDSVALRAQVEF